MTRLEVEDEVLKKIIKKTSFNIIGIKPITNRLKRFALTNQPTTMFSKVRRSDFI